jgi:class 3 adenylate cyclase
MSLKDDIIKKTKEIESETFLVEEDLYVPTISNSKLTFGCKGLEFEATVLYIDMRGSTSILNTHTKRVVAKIHMLYYHAIVKIAKATGGEIRSFNGDSLLVFYQGTTTDGSLSNAVKAALKMKYAIKVLLNENLKRYSDIDFGIGIDHGKLLATKVGIGGSDETKDLIWIGNAVNKSTKISDKCKSDYNIGISEYVYNNLTEDVKYVIKEGLFGEYNKDIWESSFSDYIDYNGKSESIYTTKYHCEIK